MKREGFEEAGELVVRHAVEHQGLFTFERLWRQHFLDTMNPGFIPTGWSVRGPYPPPNFMREVFNSPIINL